MAADRQQGHVPTPPSPSFPFLFRLGPVRGTLHVSAGMVSSQGRPSALVPVAGVFAWVHPAWGEREDTHSLAGCIKKRSVNYTNERIVTVLEY